MDNLAVQVASPDLVLVTQVLQRLLTSIKKKQGSASVVVVGGLYKVDLVKASRKVKAQVKVVREGHKVKDTTAPTDSVVVV